MKDSFKRLLVGYRNFRDEFFHEKDFFKNLKDQQKPKILCISCCDSRADPAIIFNLKPGAIFSVRNIANLIPSNNNSNDSGYYATMSAVEFAVMELKIEQILVLGHSKCAGVNAIINGYQPNKELENSKSFIENWIKIGKPIKEKNCKSNTEYEKENIKLGINNLLTFDWIKHKVESKNLTIYGVYFNMENGNLEVLDKEYKEFEVF